MHRITSRPMSPLKLKTGISVDVKIETPSLARRPPRFDSYQHIHQLMRSIFLDQIYRAVAFDKAELCLCFSCMIEGLAKHADNVKGLQKRPLKSILE